MPTALIRNVNNDFLDKFVHDLRRKFSDTLILLYRLDECCHIG